MQRQLRNKRAINDAKNTITEDILTLKAQAVRRPSISSDVSHFKNLSSGSAGCLAPAKNGHDRHRRVSACEACQKAGLWYFGTFIQFEQIHKTRRSKLMKEFLERRDMRELAGKVVEAMRKELEDLDLHDIISRYESKAGGGTYGTQSSCPAV